MRWKLRGGANFYLNRSYVIGAVKRCLNHILFAIVQLEEPARYVLLKTNWSLWLQGKEKGRQFS